VIAGLVEEKDKIMLNVMIEERMKKLQKKTPAAIHLNPPAVTLSNVPWLRYNEKLLEFITVSSSLLFKLRAVSN